MKQFFLETPVELFKNGISASQQRGIDVILKEAAGLPITYVAYLLATAYHETGATFKPVRETFAESDEKAIKILNDSFKKGRMTWVKTPYWNKDQEGKSWLGRGYVQLTHKANYIRASKELGIDLVADPTRAMKEDIAAKILVKGSLEGWFTGRKLSDYLPGDYRNARRIINGLESAAKVARYAQIFENHLREKPMNTSANWLKDFIEDILKLIFGKK